MSTSVDFYGLYHLINQTVACVICGLDCGDYVVDVNGHIQVPLQSDPDGLFTGVYVQQFDVGPWNSAAYGMLTTSLTMQILGSARKTMYVPVFIGFSYLCAGRTMPPVAPEQTKSSQGGSHGKNRRVFNWAALVQNTQGLAVGTTFANLQNVVFRGDGQQALNHSRLFSGEVFGNTQGRSEMDGTLCWAIERPYPCTINAISSFIETHERAEDAGEKPSGTLSQGLSSAISASPMGASPMGEEVPGR